ncbi:serine/threonine-protein kinase [Gemmata sp.]|uniref:serine/threonine-protein kinase n=1 Tax=Gemmata sp. TaxID=1914242 RepID=UPI003F6F8871
MTDGEHTPLMGEQDRSASRDLSLRGARPPAKVPGYEQEQYLGSGAYGEVWVAVNRNSGRKVAIKFYTRRGGLDWASLAREVEKLRYLFSDRYVVQLFEVGWESDPPYYVMEFMEHGSLEDLLRDGPVSVHDAVTYFREVAIALVHAHDKGILHCDLKPANILLDQDRRPRLADFGQSRLTNEMSPALGTLFYMAPEQADLSAAPDARWDVYALGAVVYRMLTGQPPHYQSKPLSNGNLEAQLTAYRKLILHAPKPQGHRKVPGVNAELAGIIDRCLETSPAKRFHNPQEVVSALDAWQLRRVRQPILLFSGVGFLLLMLMLTAMGWYVFHMAVSTARNGVIGRALEGNQFAARTEARQLGMQVQFRWAQLEAAGRDPVIRELLARGDRLGADPKASAELDAALAARRARSDRQFDEANRSAVWFATDFLGFQRGSDPPYGPGRNVYRGYRDYYHGQGRELDEKDGPARAIITAPHRSMVYQRSREGSGPIWSVAYSVPVWDDPAAGGRRPVGVVGIATDLRGRTQVAGSRERFAVLIDTRPDATGRRGLIVRHPYLQDLPEGAALRPVYCDAVVRWADSGAAEFPEDDEYRDPVGGAFGGTWLASVEHVLVRPEDGHPVDTGWVILVQERKDEVLQPVTALQWHLRRGGAVAAAFLLLIIVLMWAGTVSVLDASPKSRMTRLLRRWAGLPTGTGTGVGGGTQTVGSSRSSVNPSGPTPDRDPGATLASPPKPE